MQSDSKRILLSIFFDLFLFSAVFYYFISHYDPSAECGIPQATWILVQMLLVTCGLLQKGLLLATVRYCRSIRFLFSLVTTGLVYFALCTWLFYGNMLYFSERNDCREVSDATQRDACVMVFFLSVGYL